MTGWAKIVLGVALALVACLAISYRTPAGKKLNASSPAPHASAPLTPAPAPEKTELAAPNADFNYALAAHGATATGGCQPEALIDGECSAYDGGTGFGWTHWDAKPREAFIVTLKNPVKLDTVKFLLWDRDEERFYRYVLEICSDPSGDKWEIIADRSRETDECRGWQVVCFADRIVKRIRLTGTYNSATDGFHVVELQAFLSGGEINF